MIPARTLQPLQCYLRNHVGLALNTYQPAFCRPFELPVPPQAYYSTMASEADHAPGTPEWLQDRLAKLLKAPHISIPRPTGALAHIRMGPGPIDLFSTYYANFFTSDAKGVVAGKEVDREGLKQALLALQKKWHVDSAKFTPQASVENAEHPIVTAFSWSPRNFSKESAAVTASAAVQEEGGTQRISSLMLEGDSELFA
ncbi:hypothetical protein QCA50_010109 [Cerrena zonata]|uniref:Uncharacterized protein n=1 Tax=Cerrena zonata TaxID=2478898 RepID=A0AAW0FZS4_9APHY